MRGPRGLSCAEREGAPSRTYIRRPPGPMPEACEKSAPPNPQPARSHGKVRQARRTLKCGLADVASGAAQHAGGDGSLDGGALQAPQPSRKRLSSSVTDPLGQAPGTLPSQGWNELNGIRSPSTNRFHSEAQETAQAALFVPG